MSTREIGQLTPVGVLDTTALFEIEQGGNSFRTNLADMLALATNNLSAITIDTNKDWLGFDITNLGNLGVTGFIDLAEIAAPANPAVNTGRLYVQDVASTTTLFFRDSFGTATNLLAPGEVLTWTANHDANGFALVDPFFADPADNSKQMKISLGNMTTGTILTLVSNQTTTQTLNIPDITGVDEVVTELFTQQLSNKTLLVPFISDFSNATHVHTTAAEGGQLDSTLALSDTANIVYLNTPNTYVAGTRQDFLGDTGGTAGLNIGAIAGNPLTQVDGDLWYNSSTNTFFARINGVDVDLADTGSAPPFADNTILIEAVGDATKTLRLDVTGNTTGVDGVIATIFTTNKTITIPDATDTLVGKATADFFTNKTFDVDATGNLLVQATPTAGQYLRDDGAEFIGSAIQAVDLPAVVVRTDQANTFGDFAQSFADDQLLIRNPTDTFSYQIIADAIVAARSVTLPLLLGNDIFVTEAFIQTLTNKSLGTGTSWTAIPTITDGLKITFNPDNTNAGLNAGQNASEPSVAINGDIFYDSTTGFLKGRNNGVWEQLGGEVVTWTADHSAAGFDLLNVGGITINNPLDTFQYIITPDAIVADRIVNLPLLTGPDTFVMEDHTQTLINKTINSTSNTITIVKADISDFPILAADIADNNVTFIKLTDINLNEVYGRVTAGLGDPTALTATELTTIVNIFTPTLKGSAPLSGGGSVNFLRADASWAVPPGTGGGYDTVEEEGTPLAQETVLNFVGAGVTASAGAGETIITIPGGAGDSTLLVRNTTGSTLFKGEAVFISGSSGNRILVELAQADSSSTAPSIGLIQADIPNNSDGVVLAEGVLTGLDTSAFLVGDILFLSASVAGDLTATAPAHPNLQERSGVVLVSNVAIGEIAVTTGQLSGIELGTNQNTFAIGDGLAGTKTLSFVNAFTANLSWTPTAARTLTLPDATDTLVGLATTDILTNKTINATNNTILDTGIALGDILKSNGTKYVNFAKGTALQHIRVNTGGTDIEYADDGFVVLGETTLGAAGDTLSVTFVTREVLKIYYLVIASGVLNMEMSFNGDDVSGNYAFQRQQDGGAWADDINSDQIEVEPGSVDEVGTGYLVVLQTSGEERMYKQYFVGSGTTGPGTVPDKQQIDGKWADTTDITTVTITNGGAGDMDIGSRLIVMGSNLP